MNQQTLILGNLTFGYEIYLVLFNSILLAGSITFITWLVQTKMGRKSLDRIIPKANLMDALVVIFVFGIWVLTQMLVGYICSDFITALADKHADIATYIATMASAALTVLAVLIVARQYYESGIRGFGLDYRTLWQDLKYGILNYIAILPIVIFVTLTVAFLGNLFTQGNFEMPNHSLINLLSPDQPLWLNIFAIILAVVVAPIVEELLFRGVLQNFIFTISRKAWLSIFITSLAFAVIHGGAMKLHWPALFVLSCCMGYAYVKSGSIYRSIMVHAVFNGVNVVSALIMANYGAMSL